MTKNSILSPRAVLRYLNCSRSVSVHLSYTENYGFDAIPEHIEYFIMHPSHLHPVFKGLNLNLTGIESAIFINTLDSTLWAALKKFSLLYTLSCRHELKFYLFGVVNVSFQLKDHQKNWFNSNICRFCIIFAHHPFHVSRVEINLSCTKSDTFNLTSSENYRFVTDNAHFHFILY